VSSLSSEEPEYALFVFETEATIAEILEIKIIDYGDTMIALQWQVCAEENFVVQTRTFKQIFQ